MLLYITLSSFSHFKYWIIHFLYTFIKIFPISYSHKTRHHTHQRAPHHRWCHHQSVWWWEWTTLGHPHRGLPSCTHRWPPSHHAGAAAPLWVPLWVVTASPQQNPHPHPQPIMTECETSVVCPAHHPGLPHPADTCKCLPHYMSFICNTKTMFAGLICCTIVN